MPDLLAYVVFDALFAAGVPVVLAYIVIWAAALRRLRLHDYLGGGQFCLYATTLSVLTLADLVREGKNQPLVWAIAALTFIVIVATSLWAVGVVIGLSPEGTDKVRSKKRITWASIVLSVAAVILGGYFRYSWGIW